MAVSRSTGKRSRYVIAELQVFTAKWVSPPGERSDAGAEEWQGRSDFSVRSIAFLSSEKRTPDLPITFRWSLRPIGSYRIYFRESTLRVDWFSTKR